MKLKSRKATLYLMLALVFFMMPILPVTVGANPTNEPYGENVKVDETQKKASYVENARSVVAAVSEDDTNVEKSIFTGKAVVSTDSYLEVKEQADDSANTVGKLFQDSIADVVETNGEWTKITSGNVKGYVQTATLCFNEEAEAVAKLETIISGNVADDGVVVYASSTGFGEILEVMPEGTEVSPVNYVGKYLAIRYEDDSIAYVEKESIFIDYGFESGMTVEEEQEKLAAEEAARLAAEEAARKAEEARLAAEAARKAKEAALKQQVLQNTTDGKSFTYNPTIEISDDDLWMLACIIDWESGWESYEGKLAVANVVLNRVRSSHYPNTVSGVVYQKGQFGGVLTSSGGVSSSFAARLDKGPRTTECMEAAMAAVSGVNNIEGYTSFIGTSQANYEAYPIYTVIGGHCFH